MLNWKSLSVKFGGKSFPVFAYRNALAPMTRSKVVPRRREAMGGLAKGPAFPDCHSAPTL